MEAKELDKAGQATKQVTTIHKNPVVKFAPLPGDGGHQIDGITLTEQESQYLLPHFLMLVVGKPGSGKSYLIRQLLQNPAFYKDRFQHTLAISPSVQKLDLKLPTDNTFTEFNLDWLMYHVGKINEQQLVKLNAAFGLQYTPAGGMLPHDNSRLTPMSNTQIIQAKQDNIMQMAHNARYQTVPGGLRNSKDVSRFGTVPASVYKRPNSLYDFGWQKKLIHEKIANEHHRRSQLDAMDESRKKITAENAEHYMRLLSPEQRQSFHANLLILLDDCIGQIKRAEFDPKLSQLVMNRRHLLINGTISIIIVSQKFSLIPVRIRSNASWLIAFKLNPVDYNFIFEDMVTMAAKTWANVLQYIFEKPGTVVGTKQAGLQEVEGSAKKKAGAKSFMEIVKKRTYINMGIWVDYNVIFKNFEQLELN